MKRSELLMEIPSIGEILLEPFIYASGREGYMAVVEQGKGTREFNMTYCVEGVHTDLMILKMEGECLDVAKHLLQKTDLFSIEGGQKPKVIEIGFKKGLALQLNPEYYERT